MGDRLRAAIPSRYVTSQLGQLSIASLRGRLIEYHASAGVRAGMSPLPGDPLWHVSSRSGVATLRTAIHLLLTYLLTMASRRLLSRRPGILNRQSRAEQNKIDG